MVKDALGFIVALHLCPSVHEKGGQEEKAEKCMPSLFPFVTPTSEQDQHWIGSYCALGASLLHTEIKGSAQ